LEEKGSRSDYKEKAKNIIVCSLPFAKPKIMTCIYL